MQQDKNAEIAFFQRHAESEPYDVFTETSNLKLLQACIQFSDLHPPGLVADLGCGSGVFTKLLLEHGFHCLGLDISHALTSTGKRHCSRLAFSIGDVECLPFRSESLDGVFLSGILHHLPDPSLCAREIFRILKPNGVCVGFDPNRLNPFMWLYRAKNSPFYSNLGVTKNEQPILAADISRVFMAAGFRVSTDYLSGLQYRYVASHHVRWALPIYNLLDDILFRFRFFKPYSAFVLTKGVK